MNRAMRFAPLDPTPEGLAALEAIRQMGFKLDSSSGAHRLIRSDGSQAALYTASGKMSLSGLIANITDLTQGDAAIAALKVAQAVLADEAARLALPRPIFGKDPAA